MTTRAACAGLTFLGLFIAGCSMNGLAGVGDSAQAEVDETRKLKEHIVELERRAAMVEVEVKRLRKRVEELEGGATREERNAVASEPERAAPRDRLSLPAPMPPAGRLESADLLEEAPPREAAEALEKPRQTAKRPAQTAVAPVDTSKGALSTSAQALYDRGYTLFHQGRYVDSETAFQQFLQRHAGTVLGDNAQFWIAEARYARGDVNGALAAFRETTARFPGGNKVPDAHLKIGDCLRDLGDSEGARRKYAEVVEGHPNSAAAAIAEERIAALR